MNQYFPVRSLAEITCLVSICDSLSDLLGWQPYDCMKDIVHHVPARYSMQEGECPVSASRSWLCSREQNGEDCMAGPTERLKTETGCAVFGEPQRRIPAMMAKKKGVRIRPVGGMSID